MRVAKEFGFYAILTEPVVGYERLSLLLVKYKVPFIQIRIKNKDYGCFLAVAKLIREITKDTATKLIINDNPYIASEVGADGVHIGQEDLDYLEVRRIVGDKMIIGLSTHNMGQVNNANILKPDYIGVGPVYNTPTKEKADPALGLELMKQMIAQSKMPAVAIGGINEQNLKAIREHGALNFSAVRWLNQSTEPESALKDILATKSILLQD